MRCKVPEEELHRPLVKPMVVRRHDVGRNGGQFFYDFGVSGLIDTQKFLGLVCFDDKCEM